MGRDSDILMITYQSPDYVARSLPALLGSVGDRARVWVWHNGDDADTLSVVKSYAGDLHRFHHSHENLRLRAPTLWLWSEASGDYVSKVDDDCIIDDGWVDTLRSVHESNPGLGAIGASRLREEDRDADALAAKMVDLEGGHRLVRNLWVQGSGYLLPRRVVSSLGGLRKNEAFGRFCKRAAAAGWTNGWYFPLIFEDHMDDPLSPNTALVDQRSFEERMPLSAQRLGITTLEGWTAEVRRNAAEVQHAPYDPKRYKGARRRVQNALARLSRS